MDLLLSKLWQSRSIQIQAVLNQDLLLFVIILSPIHLLYFFDTPYRNRFDRDLYNCFSNLFTKDISEERERFFQLFKPFCLRIWTVIFTINCFFSHYCLWVESTQKIMIAIKIFTVMTRNLIMLLMVKFMLSLLGNISKNWNNQRKTGREDRDI